MCTNYSKHIIELAGLRIIRIQHYRSVNYWQTAKKGQSYAKYWYNNNSPMFVIILIYITITGIYL